MSTRWQAARMWPGETVVVAATGQSLKREDLEAVRGRCRVVAVSNAWELAPWADVCYAADRAWWKFHWPKVSGFGGLKVGVEDLPGRAEHLLMGHDTDGEHHKFENFTHLQGSNSGAEAAHLAFMMAGGSQIWLGCDCTGTHFFGRHPAPLDRGSDYRAFIASFTVIGKQIEQRGGRVINASAGSQIAAFPKMPLADALRGLPGGDREELLGTEWRVHERP